MDLEVSYAVWLAWCEEWPETEKKLSLVLSLEQTLLVAEISV